MGKTQGVISEMPPQNMPARMNAQSPVSGSGACLTSCPVSFSMRALYSSGPTEIRPTYASVNVFFALGALAPSGCFSATACGPVTSNLARSSVATGIQFCSLQTLVLTLIGSSTIPAAASSLMRISCCQVNGFSYPQMSLPMLVTLIGGDSTTSPAG